MWPLTSGADKWLTLTCGEQAEEMCAREDVLTATAAEAETGRNMLQIEYPLNASLELM